MKKSSQQKRTRLKHRLKPQRAVWMLAVLFVVTTIVYRESLGCFFYHDDLFLVSQIQQLSLGEFVKQSLSGSTSIPANLGWLFRPVPHYLYFSLGYHLFGLNAGPYHIFHLLLHAFNAWLIFHLVARITSSRRAGIITALLFVLAVRVHFESIFWISGIVEISMTFFLLVSFNLYISAVDQTKYGAFYGFISISGYVLALLCKETALIFPALVLITEILRERTRPKEMKSSSSRRVIWLISIYTVLTLIYLVLRSPRLIQAAGSSSSYAVSLNIKTIIEKYLWGLIWSVDTIESGITRLIPNLPLFWPSILAFYMGVVGLLGWLMLQAKSRERKRWFRSLLLWSSWFVIGLLPVLLTNAFAAYLFMWSCIGLFAVLGMILDSTLRRLETKYQLPPLRVLLPLFVLLLISAALRASDLDQSAWPPKYADLNRQTIAWVKEKHPSFPNDSCIYLAGFPSRTWFADTAPFVFNAFFQRDDLAVFLESEPSALDRIAQCRNVFVFSYVQGQIEESSTQQVDYILGRDE